jgi:hypothetical protein
MKNSNLLVGGALIILVLGIIMYKKSKKSTTPAPVPAPAATPAPVPAPALVCQQPVGGGGGAAPLLPGQVIDNATPVQMQSFIK